MTSRIVTMGVVGTDLITEVKIISCICPIDKYETFNFPIGTNYQVTAGKTFYGGLLINAPSGANGDIIIGYGDTAVSNSDAAPTNAVPLTQNIFTLLANTTVTLKVFFAVPAAKYPYVLASTAIAYAHVVGIEI